MFVIRYKSINLVRTYHEHLFVLKIELLDVMNAALHGVLEVYKHLRNVNLECFENLQSLVSSSDEELFSASSAISMNVNVEVCLSVLPIITIN